MVSFASTVTNDVPMTNIFKTAISTAVSNLAYAGGTFSPGGPTNALVQLNGFAIPPGQNAIKVVVFFTDGMANMIQNNFTCPGTTNQAWNFGGWLEAYDPVGFWDPNTTNTCFSEECPQYANESGVSFSDPLTCGTVNCGGDGGIPTFCPGATTFPSITGTNEPINAPKIVLESQARCIQIAGQMRTNGMYVYCVGLASSMSADAQPNPVFLQEVANDPNSPFYNSELPVGQAVISGNGADLNQLFQQIAGDILLRLTY